MSLPKLTSISTQTLSLLLERQRLQTLPSFSPSSEASNHNLSLITRNLAQLRAGILDLDSHEEQSESLSLLKSQYERMREMAGNEANVESLVSTKAETALTPFTDIPSASSFPLSSRPPGKEAQASLFPYSDDPEMGYEPGIMLQTQRQMMDEQDDHLEHLSHSIGRQHHISLQINDELDVHTGLLEGLDSDLDRTESRLTGARRRLDRVAQGARENGSIVTIGLLIFILLILVIVFKTF